MTLPQRVDQTLEAAGWIPSQVQAIAVSLGPGSYAGIRTAIAFAQGWQLVHAVRLVGVPSADALAAAAQAAGRRGAHHVLIDAQRGEFYRAEYELGEETAVCLSSLKIVSSAEALAGLAVARGLSPDAPALGSACEEAFPTAATIAQLAARHLAQPAATDALADTPLEPVYLRPVQFAKTP